jgi:hypothetical protein
MKLLRLMAASLMALTVLVPVFSDAVAHRLLLRPPQVFRVVAPTRYSAGFSYNLSLFRGQILKNTPLAITTYVVKNLILNDGIVCNSDDSGLYS